MRPLYYQGGYARPLTGLPHWTRQDEINLRNRIRRLTDRPEPVESSPAAMPQITNDGCIECRTAHCKPARVGPYTICRCLRCPVLVAS